MSSGAYVFVVSRIGDVVEATLTFDALAARYRAGVTAVTSPAAHGLLARDARLRGVAVVRSSHPLVWRWEVAGVLARARREGAAVVNLEVYRPRWRFLRHVARVLRLVSWHLDLDAFRAEFEDVHRTGDGARFRHRAIHYAAAVGITAGDPPAPRLHVDPAAARRVEERLSGWGKEDRPLVVLHAGSSPGWTSKRADAGFYAEVLRGVAARGRARGILVGVSEERGFATEILERAGGDVAAWNWAGALALEELPALVQRASLFIGNDSGPLKVAEAVGARTVSIWIDSWPEQAAPRGPGHRVVRVGVPPHACAGAGCAAPVHRDRLGGPADVVSAALELLAQNGGAGGGVEAEP